MKYKQKGKREIEIYSERGRGRKKVICTYDMSESEGGQGGTHNDGVMIVGKRRHEMRSRSRGVWGL